MTLKQRDPRITLLIDCGRAGDLRAVSVRFSRLCPFEDDLLGTAAQNLHNWLNDGIVTNDELGALAKVLVVAENAGLFSLGSTNSISRVAHLINEADLNWLYVCALNPYVPFGCDNNCRSSPDLESYRKCLELRQLEADLVAVESRVNSARKAYEGSCRRAEKQRQQAAVSAYRDREFAELRKLSITERVTRIARSHRPIHYFPEEFADIPMEDLRQIAADVRALFAEKLAKATRGKWRRLHTELKVA
jgi:hypothetical protein